MSDPQSHYKNCENDDAADPKYYGLESVSGTWVIIKRNMAAGTMRYCSGVTGFAEAWTNRASLGYDYPSKIRWY